MTELYKPIAQQGYPTLIKDIGDIWLTMKALIKNGDASPAETVFSEQTFKVYGGCINDSWEFGPEISTEEIPFSCKTGSYTLNKDKIYKGAFSSKTLTPLAIAAFWGQKISLGAVSGQTIIIQKEATVTLTHATTTIALDSFLTDLLAASQIHKILSLKRKSTGDFWSQCEAGDESNTTFLFSVDATNPDLTFDAALSATVDEEFVIRIQYTRAMAAGDFKSSEDGVTFPGTFDATFGWYVTNEKTGEKAYLLANVKNCHATTVPKLGGNTKDISMSNIEFTVDFTDDGDIELHQEVIA